MFGRVRFLKNGHNEHGKDNIILYVLLGDSLTEGILTEESAGLDTKYQSANRVMIYYKPDRTSTDNGSWQVYKTRANPTINRSPGNTISSGGPYHVGPDQAFVYGLDQSAIKKNIGILKLGKGGSMLIARTGLDNDWVPTGGELYTNLVSHIYNVAIPKLHTAGYRNVQVKAIIARLGTNDAATARWIQADFIAAVPAFISALRRDFSNSSIPVYWVQVRSDLNVVAGFDSTTVSQVRTALVNCKSGGSTAISGFNLIETYDSDGTTDGVHQTEAACLTQGENEANLMIALGE